MSQEIIRDAVGELYQRFPYPSYPLWLPLRWQDGYAGSSLFAARLFENQFQHPAAIYADPRSPRIMLAGCGEALPYILRKLEPRAHHMVSVDLSKRSVQRAKLRLLWESRSHDFYAGDLTDFLRTNTQPFAHIDSYGVLHHLANPSEVIRLLSQSLAVNGTMRIMVYNTRARKWLFHMNRALRLLKLDGFVAADRAQGHVILQQLAHLSPSIQERFASMGKETFHNPARFVDTFFHRWEMQWSIAQWFEAFRHVNIVPIGVFDRYAELDDLANPLWQPPAVTDLEARAKDLRYENNLELYLAKVPAQKPESRRRVMAKSYLRQYVRSWRRSPPQRWFQYEETKSIPIHLRWRLWHRHLSHLYGLGSDRVDELQKALDTKTLQRLARVGAIFPQQVQNRMIRRALYDPMVDRMDIPDRHTPAVLESTDLAATVERTLRDKNCWSPERVAQVLARLGAAQH